MSRLRKGGFTVVELTIVLAISSFLFISAATLFARSDRNVRFTEAVNDFNSQLNSYAKEISTGAFEENFKYDCKYDPDYNNPRLIPVTTPGNLNECIYLGKAIMPVTNSSTIHVYDVVGLKNNWDEWLDTDTGQLAKTLDESGSQPAMTNFIPPVTASSWAPEYSRDYQLKNGVTILSAKTYDDVGVVRTNAVLKIYSNLQANNTTLRTVIPMGADFNGAVNSTLLHTSAKNCIGEVSKCAKDAGNGRFDLTNRPWELCLQSAEGKRAQINVKAVSTGIKTEIIYDAVCS